MKILITNIEVLNTTNGPAVFITKLLHYLPFVKVLTYSNSHGYDLHPGESTLGGKIIFNEIIWIPIRGWRMLFREIREADVIHISMFNFSELFLAYIMKAFGKRIIWTIHSHIIIPLDSLKNTLENMRVFFVFTLFLPFVDRIIFLTEAHRTNFRKYTPFHKLLDAKSRIIPNAIEPERILSQRIAPASPAAVIYVGRFQKQKGFEELLRLERDMEHEDVRFTLVGGEPSPLFGPPIKNVYFIEPVLNDRVFELYDQANILLLPSHSECFPIVILEAMARGLVILVSDVPGMREIITEGRNGFLFPTGNTMRMKEIILYLRDHPEEIDRISRNNLEDIRRFSVALQATRYMEIYCDTLAAAY